jgi:hypothetical protein
MIGQGAERMAERSHRTRSRHWQLIGAGGVLIVAGLFMPWLLGAFFGAAGAVLVVVGIVRLCILHTSV